MSLKEKILCLKSCLSNDNDSEVLVQQDTQAESCKELFVPPGHFYSPIPSLKHVEAYRDRVFGNIPDEIPGVNLRKEEQFSFLHDLKKYYSDLPFPVVKSDNLRFFFDNPAYSYSDAIFLYSMIRHLKPKRVIEIGSGYSSCVTLDTNELFFQNSIDVTFIEPYPELLISLITTDDKKRTKVISSDLQDVDIEVFKKLEANDILFIDSSHVVKFFSDVNYAFAEILPALAKGVYIHFHDIFYPFEYKEDWILENRGWNEVYFLRTFLQYNYAFEIAIHNRFLAYFYKDYFEENMPLCLKKPGASIWLKKLV